MIKKETACLQVDIVMSDEYVELCGYFLLYAKNLRSNWLYSQKVFQEKILPLALKNPEQFAIIVNNMVKKSGEKIQSRGLFATSIKYIESFTSLKKAKVKHLSMALNDLLNSGLKNSIYAQNAILKLSS